MQSDFAFSSVYEQSSALCAPLSLRIVPTCVVSIVCVCVVYAYVCVCVYVCELVCVCVCDYFTRVRYPKFKLFI